MRRNACRVQKGRSEYHSFWNGFDWFSKMFHFNDDGRHDSLGITLEQFHEYQLIGPIATRALINFATADTGGGSWIDTDYRRNIFYIIEEHRTLWQVERTLPEDPRREKLDNYREYFRPLWLSTLRSLRKLNAVPPFAPKPIPTSCVQTWVQYGRDLGIFPTDSIPSEPVRFFTEHRGCHWRGCMCHGLEACHKMRVYKGCSRALYCCEKCQRSDWLKGKHKTQCKKWRKLNNVNNPLAYGA
ncbi:hypothetical protein C8Q75DRAFT_310850 [Abortiporus biennis]|nr:hypothetical protein C8Q75DRAFT_310850 [Abortiporus biennis]